MSITAANQIVILLYKIRMAASNIEADIHSVINICKYQNQPQRIHFAGRKNTMLQIAATKLGIIKG